jgi:hypothetical protein
MTTASVAARGEMKNVSLTVQRRGPDFAQEGVGQ